MCELVALVHFLICWIRPDAPTDPVCYYFIVFFYIFLYIHSFTQSLPCIIKRFFEQWKSFVALTKNTLITLQFPTCNSLNDIFGDDWYVSFYEEYVSFINCKHRIGIIIKLQECVVTMFQSPLVEGKGEFKPIQETFKQRRCFDFVSFFCPLTHRNPSAGTKNRRK